MPRHAPVLGASRTIAAAAILGGLVAGGSAMAGTAPDIMFDLSVSDGTMENLLLAGSTIGPDLYNYAGDYNTAGFELSYNFAASADPTDAMGAFIGSGFTIMNNSDEALTFSLMLTLNLAAPTSPATQYAGSAGFTLTGIDGSLTTDSALFTGLIDGMAIESAFEAPFELSFMGQDTADVSASLLGGEIGPANSTISLALDFTLSPGDIVTTTGAFGILQVPAPGAAALLTMAAFAGGRRRRR